MPNCGNPSAGLNHMADQERFIDKALEAVFLEHLRKALVDFGQGLLGAIDRCRVFTMQVKGAQIVDALRVVRMIMGEQYRRESLYLSASSSCWRRSGPASIRIVLSACSSRIEVRRLTLRGLAGSHFPQALPTAGTPIEGAAAKDRSLHVDLSLGRARSNSLKKFCVVFSASSSAEMPFRSARNAAV